MIFPIAGFEGLSKFGNDIFGSAKTGIDATEADLFFGGSGDGWGEKSNENTKEDEENDKNDNEKGGAVAKVV